MTIYESLLKSFEENPKGRALIYENAELSYTELVEQISIAVGKLKTLGLNKGDVVAINLPNCFQAVILLYAVNAIGAIGYFIHPLTPAKQLALFMKNTDAKALFCISLNANENYKEIGSFAKVIAVNPYVGVNFIKAIAVRKMSGKLDAEILRLEKIKDSGERIHESYADHAPAIYLNSGGTNGDPKVIELSNEAIVYLSYETIKVIGDIDYTKASMLTAIPLFHGFGLVIGVLTLLANRAASCLVTKFSTKEACRQLRRGKANIIIGVPALYEALLQSPKFKDKACKDIIACYIGGDNVTSSLLDRFNEHIKANGGTAKLYEGYGLTETVTLTNVNCIYGEKRGSVGRPVGDLKEVILDLETREVLPPNKEGEIAISGSTLMEGYFKDPELTKNSFVYIDGRKYVLTKDLGYMDEDGYLYFRQRLRRVAKINGIPVCPSDIEKSALKCDGVYDCYGYAVHDDRFGQILELALVKNTKSSLTEEQIVEEVSKYIKEDLSVYHKPKRIYFMDALPRTSVGKIDSTKFPS